MKNLKLAFIVSLFIIDCGNGQVDTADWFPIQTGNYWEYMAWDSPPKYFSTKVIGDSLMPNGKEYKVFYTKYFDNSSDFTLYYRKETDSIFLYTGISAYFPLGEYKFLDFVTPDSTIWLVLPIYICCNPNARGISSTFYDYTYYNFLQKSNKAKQFEDVYVDSVDTLWTPNDGSFPIVLNRGLGIVWHFIFNDGSYYLQGTIINGVRMGVITAIQNEIENVTNSFTLSQNYPNPFNPSTKIHFTIPTSPLNPSPYQGEGNRERFVTLKVFDVLGKEVATLVNEEKPAGSYEVEFNSVETLHATSLPSGVYFYQLKAGNYIETKKMILMK